MNIVFAVANKNATFEVVVAMDVNNTVFGETLNLKTGTDLLRVKRIHMCLMLQAAANKVIYRYIYIYICKFIYIYIYISNILKIRLVRNNSRNLFFILNVKIG